MGKLLFTGMHGSADSTSAAMPFIMANGAVQAGHVAVAVMAGAMSRWCYARKMAWLAPRVARAVPYLGFILVSGTGPEST